MKALRKIVVLLVGMFAISGSASAQSIEAVGFKSAARPEETSRGLYVQVRSTPLAVEGKQGKVICPSDGAGEILFENSDGDVFAVNGSARKWRDLWVWRGRLVRVADNERNSNIAQKNASSDIIDAGSKLCPQGPMQGGAARAAQAIVQALDSYPSLSRRLGIVLP